MSKTNCLRPRSGFCLNLRVRIVKSLIAAAAADLRAAGRVAGEASQGAGHGLSQNGYGGFCLNLRV